MNSKISTLWNFNEALYLCSIIEKLNECDINLDDKVYNLYLYLSKQEVPAFLYAAYHKNRFLGLVIDCCGDFWDMCGNDFIRRKKWLNSISSIELMSIKDVDGYSIISNKSLSDLGRISSKNIKLLSPINDSSSHAFPFWVETTLPQDSFLNVFEADFKIIDLDSVIKFSAYRYESTKNLFFKYIH